jgi:hypothetical protein
MIQADIEGANSPWECVSLPHIKQQVQMDFGLQQGLYPVQPIKDTSLGPTTCIFLTREVSMVVCIAYYLAPF